MIRRTSRNWLLAGAAVVLAVGLAVAWHAGGPQPLREISIPVAVPEIAR